MTDPEVRGPAGPGRRFLRGVAVSTAGNSQAFGYSITITATYGAVSAVHGSPSPGQLIAFALLGVTAFSLLNLTVVRVLPHDQNDSEARRVLLIATATDVLAVGAAIGTAIGIAAALSAWPAWLLAPFAASLIYVFVQAIELAVGRAQDKER